MRLPLLLISLGILVLANASHAGRNLLTITTTAANVRSAPSSTASVIVTLKRGTKVEALDTGKNYFKIKTLGKKLVGWIYAPAQHWRITKPILAPAPETRKYPDKTASIAKKKLTATPASQGDNMHQDATNKLIPSYPFKPKGDNRIFSGFLQLRLEMDPLDAKVLYRKDKDDTSSFPVTIKNREQKLTGSIAVKGSFSRNFLKKSLKIKLNDQGKWRGSDKFTLNAMSTDPTQMREWLAWDLMKKAGMKVPEPEFVRVYINQEFIGLYLLFDWLDSDFLATLGLGSEGYFYHPNDEYFCGDLMPANQSRINQCWLNFSSRDVQKKLQPETDASPSMARWFRWIKDSNLQDKTLFKPLYQLIEEINAAPVDHFDTFLEKHFDTDSILDWLAINTITGNGDTYNKNYFLYYSTLTKKWLVIPWDYDLVFGRSADPSLPFPKSIFNDNFQTSFPPELGANNPLKNKTLKNPQLLKRFRARIGHYLGSREDPTAKGGFGWFSPGTWLSRLDKLEDRLLSDRNREKYLHQDSSVIRKEINALRWYGLMRHAYLDKNILQPNAFGTARWLPYVSFPLLVETPPAYPALNLSNTFSLDSTTPWQVLTEDWLSLPLGLIHVKLSSAKTRFRIAVEQRKKPDFIPAGVDASQCIQRTWLLDVQTPHTSMTVDLYLDYLQETVQNNERTGVKNESRLTFRLFDGRWRKLKTRINTLSNTLTTTNLRLQSSKVYRLVACTDETAETH